MARIRSSFRYTPRIFIIGMVLLTITDWLWAYYEIPIFIVMSRYLRAFMLGMFMWFIYRTGLDFGRGGMMIGRVLQFIAVTLLIYAIFDPDMGEGFYQYFRTLYWIIGAVVAYRLTALGKIDLNYMIRFIKIVSWIAIVFTYFYIQTPRFIIDYNASAYLLLYCLPILLQDRSKFSFFTICLSVLGILVTVKRGAILGLVLSFLGFLFIFVLMKPNIRRLINAGAFLTLFLVIGAAGTYMQYERMQERTKIEELTDPERGGSGRFGMWRKLTGEWMAGDPVTKFFGHGNRAVIRSWDIYEHARFAHSDVIAFLYNYGVIGLIMLAWLHVSIIQVILRMFKLKHYLTPSLFMSYITLVCVNVYSEAFVGPQVLFLFLSVSFCAATGRRSETMR